jgi:hypothetical protein
MNTKEKKLFEALDKELQQAYKIIQEKNWWLEKNYPEILKQYQNEKLKNIIFGNE